MFAKAAFFAINSSDYFKSLTLVLSLNAAQYRWANSLQKAPCFLSYTLFAGTLKLFDAVTSAIETTLFMQNLLKIEFFALLLQNILIKTFAKAYPINCAQETYIQVLLQREIFPRIEAMHRITGQYPSLCGPFFIVLEGGRASGKTTQILNLKKYLENCVDDPSRIVVDKTNNDAIKPLLLALLSELGISDPTAYESRLPNAFFFQGLLTMQTRRIISALQAGSFVIADRWRDSYLVHNIMQSPFGVLEPKVIAAVDKLIFGTLCPHVKILLDVDTEIARMRVGKRNRSDKHRASTASFLDDSRLKFLLCFQLGGYIINTDRNSPDEIFEAILDIVKFHYDLLLMSKHIIKQRGRSAMRTSLTLFHPPEKLPMTTHVPIKKELQPYPIQ